MTAPTYDLDNLALELDAWLPTVGAVSLAAIATRLGVPEHQARRAIAHHRRELGSASWALIVVDGWLYYLTDDDDLIRAYEDGRLDDLESRLLTLGAIAERAVTYTDGRTGAGKRARTLHKHLTRLREDVIDARAG